VTLAKKALDCGTAQNVTLARQEAITARNKPVIKVIENGPE
jgi:hypothetical protein